MIKDNQRVFNRLLVLIDILIILASLPMAYLVKFRILSPGASGVLLFSSYTPLIAIIAPVYLFVFFFSGVYDPKRTTRIKYECANILKASTISMGVLIIAIFIVIKEINYSRWVLGLFFCISAFSIMAFRVVLRKTLRYLRKHGYNQKHILLVGYSEAAEKFIDKLVDNPQWGYAIYGIIDNEKSSEYKYRNIHVIGKIDDLTSILQSNDLSEVAITLSLEDYDILEDVVNICEKQGVHTQFVPDYSRLIPGKSYTEDLFGLPVINIRYVPLATGGNAAIKRAADFVGALFGIILTSPIMLIAAVLVKLSSPGPVLFKQERIGLHNKSFYMYKFRSMRMQTVSEEKSGWTVKNDPRVTPIGAILRKTSLDELPQLFNILLGDMSLVGPRPERPQFVEKFKEEIPRYMIKHQVRPGLTGWAQINGLRGDTSIEDRIKYDIYYIENWSIGFDIRIIIGTFFTGFVNKNAY